ncbi:MAG: glycogen debranching enzyme, partial [Verrucomicrobia bacterium]|nr:glycogen debranching enzyme [Verrucomicrobiota bacterium]
GPSDDPAIEKLRNRQVKNFLTVTLLSLGMPMIVMGDEVRRSQGGNNNAYCQDSETSWFDWTLLKRHADVHRFFKLLTARRLLRGTEHESERMSLNRLIEAANKAWHGARLNHPDWSDHSRTLALNVEMRQEKLFLHFILNAYWEPLEFELPLPGKGRRNPWRRWIDTALETPDDIVPWEKARAVPGLTYRAEPRSVVVLYAGQS